MQCHLVAHLESYLKVGQEWQQEESSINCEFFQPGGEGKRINKNFTNFAKGKTRGGGWPKNLGTIPKLYQLINFTASRYIRKKSTADPTKSIFVS